MKPKKVVVIADLHSGSRVGLTPRQWQQIEHKNSENEFIRNCYTIRREMYDWYEKEIRSLAPIDILVCNGDAVDGPGTKSGGTDQISSKIDEQKDMAFHCISEAKAKKYIMIAGTEYHTGITYDAELDIKNRLKNSEFEEEKQYDINGVIIDLKHFVPGGRALTAGPSSLKRMIIEDLINVLRGDKSKTPADIYIRSHIHKYEDTPGFIVGTRAFTTPALQARGSKFGKRKCGGIYDIGFLSFNIIGKGEWTWMQHAFQPQSAVVIPQKL